MEEEMRTVLLGLGHPVSWGMLGPGTALPRIVCQLISGGEDITLSGAVGVIRGRVQVDCYAGSYIEARNLRVQVRGLLSGYRGGPLRSVKLDAIRDAPDASGGDVIQRASLDFSVNYTA